MRVALVGLMVAAAMAVAGCGSALEETANKPTTTEKAAPTTTAAPAPTTTEAPTTPAAPTTAAPATTTPPADHQLSFEERIDNDDAIGAYDVCKQFVERRLTSPASAEYPDYFEDDGEVTVWRLANGDYRVYSQVDSENGFGASLRSVFQCTVDYKGGGNYELVQLELL